MGNSKSVAKRRTGGTREVTRRDTEPSQQTDEIVEIQECEALDEVVKTDTDHDDCCAHRCREDSSKEGCPGVDCRYILMNDLTLDKLPLRLRDKSVLEFLQVQEKLVVKLLVSKISNKRKPKKKAKRHMATGHVWLLPAEEIQVHQVCPRENCHFNDRQPHKAYGGLIVYTNRHVLFDNFEARHCKVQFFYNSLGAAVARPKNVSAALSSTATLNHSAATEVKYCVPLDSETTILYDDIPRPDGEITISIGSVKNDCDGILSTEVMGSAHTPKNDFYGESKNCVELQTGDTTQVTSGAIGTDSDRTNLARQRHVATRKDAGNSIHDHVVSSEDFPHSQGGPDPDTGEGQRSSDCEDNLPLIEAFGVRLRENKENKDLVGLIIAFHEAELFEIIQKLSKQRFTCWKKIPMQLKWEMRKHAIVISHPHGRPKQISFGKLISLEEMDEEGRKKTTYNAATCEASSGAPVVTGHYDGKPFTHSTKCKPSYLNFSLSY